MDPSLPDLRSAFPLPPLVSRVPPLATAVRRVLFPDPALEACAGALDEHGDLCFARLQEQLGIRCTPGECDLAAIPATGPVVAVANHPFGLLEGILLAGLLPRVRPDVRILANSLLSALPGAARHFLFVNPFGGPDAVRENVRAMRSALEWVRAGGMLVVFPAGEVASLGTGEAAVSDPRWNDGAAAIIRQTGAAALPIYFAGANSLSFHLLGLLHPRLRTARLIPELLNKRGTEVTLHIGHAIAGKRLQSLASDAARTRYLRWRTYLLSGERPRRLVLPRRAPHRRAVIAAVPRAALRSEIRALGPEACLGASGSFSVYQAEAWQIPETLREIGRLREVTFRAAGEGTGRSCDLDRFDRYYRHLFVYEREREEIAGAYRFCETAPVMERLGARGLYTHQLFRFDSRLFERLGPSLELGRSFVRAEYQKQYAPLLLLWRGILAWVALHPQCASIFGPVSISRDYGDRSRRVMVSALTGTPGFEDLAALVKPRRPYRTGRGDFEPARMIAGDLDALSGVVSELERDGKGIPVLLRQYLKLGGTVLGFNVDHSFTGVLDGLIVVDLRRTGRRTLERYMTRDQASRFFEYHAAASEPQAALVGPLQ
jgi:putative hemolysin